MNEKEQHGAAGRLQTCSPRTEHVCRHNMQGKALRKDIMAYKTTVKWTLVGAVAVLALFLFQSIDIDYIMHGGEDEALNHNHTVLNSNFHDWIPGPEENATEEIPNTDANGIILMLEGVTLPSPSRFRSNAAQAEITFHKFVLQLDVVCRTQVRLGNQDDGGWNMCLGGPYQPTHNDALVYSFGINNDFSFDDAFAAKYGATVRAFDPSMTNAVYTVRKSPGWGAGRVYFYPVGVGGMNTVNAQKWRIRTIRTLIHELQDTNRTIDYMKMDIEYSEWSVFETLLRDNVLERVKQFSFEIHTNFGQHRPATPAHYRMYYTALRGLWERGFRKWYVHSNPSNVYTSRFSHLKRPCCYEMVYININFLKRDGYSIPPLDPVVLPRDPLVHGPPVSRLQVPPTGKVTMHQAIGFPGSTTAFVPTVQNNQGQKR